MCLGGTPKVTQNVVKPADPAPSPVQASDVSAGNSTVDALDRQRKKRGYASTKAGGDSILGSLGGKNTLG